MPCPHLSRVNGDCLLQQDLGPDSDDGREPVQVEVVAAGEAGSALRRWAPRDRECCLGGRDRYGDCPILRRFLAELVP